MIAKISLPFIADQSSRALPGLGRGAGPADQARSASRTPAGVREANHGSETRKVDLKRAEEREFKQELEAHAQKARGPDHGNEREASAATVEIETTRGEDEPRAKVLGDEAAESETGAGRPVEAEESAEAVVDARAEVADAAPPAGVNEAGAAEPPGSATGAGVESGERAEGAGGKQSAAIAGGTTPANDATTAATRARNDGSVPAGGPPEASRPLTIRELNRALQGLDRQAVPAGLLGDLGIGARAAGEPAAHATLSFGIARPGWNPESRGSAEAAGAERAPFARETGGAADETARDAGGRGSEGSEERAGRGQAGPWREGGAQADRALSGVTSAPLSVGPNPSAAPTTAGATIAAQTSAAAPASTATMVGGSGANLAARLGEAAVVASTARSAGTQGPDVEAFEQQVARGLAAAISQRADGGGGGAGSVTLRLTPRALGPLLIEVELEGSAVRVRFTARSTETARRLDEAMQALRAGLEEKGLELREAATRIAGAGRAQGTHGGVDHAARGSEHASDQRGATGANAGHAGDSGSGGAGYFDEGEASGRDGRGAADMEPTGDLIAGEDASIENGQWFPAEPGGTNADAGMITWRLNTVA